MPAFIEHVAVWTHDLERLRAFYETHFGAQAGPKYLNPRKQFESYFLSFPAGGRLELMRRPDLTPAAPLPAVGWAHLALAVGRPAEVDALAARLAAAGVPVLDGPRWTGDGYYECVVTDPDGNRVEVTADNHRSQEEKTV